MLVFGLGLSAAVPAKQVLALNWSSSADRRKIFAYKFTGESLGMAAGAFLAGLVVDLNRTDGLDVGFLMAAAGFVLASAIIALAGSRLWARTAPLAGAAVKDARGEASARSIGGVDAETGAIAVIERDGTDAAPRAGGALRAIFAEPAMRWTAIVTITLALGFYAQFESGLPAYALTTLRVDPSAIGTAAAVNCLVIVAIQVVIVKLTASRTAPVLLMAVGGIWALSWVILSAAQFMPGIASALFVMTYGVFAVGETIYSPVLNPLTASLAPKGMVGQTLGTVAALQTAFSAAGPLVAGVLLGAGLADVFLGIHLAISLVAVFAAWRVHRALLAKAERERLLATHAERTGVTDVAAGRQAATSARGATSSRPARPVTVNPTRSRKPRQS